MPIIFFIRFIALALLLCVSISLHSEEVGEDAKILFNGQSLENWMVTDYAGHGEVKLDGKGSVYLEFGIALTGIHWTGKPLPLVNYEIHWEAMKEMGTDFFGSLTFPYKQNHATLILGGWGGALVGISCIDGFDASENESSTAHYFKAKQWYKCRLRVSDTHFKFWVDEEKLIDFCTDGREISLRSGEIEMSKPLGFSTYDTTGLIRKVVLHNLKKNR
ncbi:MAG: family 16 glycoside hydrolase [Opitutae bacterium]